MMGFTAEGGVSDLSAVLMTGLEPSAASRRAVRHGNLDGNAPDLVRVTGVSETIAPHGSLIPL
jgi:hypothetical protein